MIKILTALFAVLTVSVAQAQPLHGYPGKDAYNSIAERPDIDGQCHWKDNTTVPPILPPNTLVPGMSHTHLVTLKPPIWAEIGSMAYPTIDIPIAVKLFHTDGSVTKIWARVFGANGQVSLDPSDVQIDTLPVVGDPNGLVVVNGRVHFDPSIGLSIIPHGWFTMEVGAETLLSNGTKLGNSTRLPFYSVLDPDAPEIVAPTLLIAGCTATQTPGDTDFESYGGNIVQFSQPIPILTPITTPQVVESQAYAYSNRATFFQQRYDVLLDNDYHMSVEGTPQPTASDTIGNSYNRMNPLAMSASPTPMGLQPHQHRWTFQWAMASGDGFDSQFGHVNGGEELRTLLSVIVTTGDNPTDDDPATFWTTDSLAPPPPPVIIEPPPQAEPLWRSIVPIFCQNTVTGEVKAFPLVSCDQVP